MELNKDILIHLLQKSIQKNYIDNWHTQQVLKNNIIIEKIETYQHITIFYKLYDNKGTHRGIHNEIFQRVVTKEDYNTEKKNYRNQRLKSITS